MVDFDIKSCTLSGINLIEAGAGTGKTYSISKLFIRLLIENKIPIDNILVVTFTEAATEELRSRIRSEIRNTIDNINQENKESYKILEYALNNFDEAAIFTIHGFCRKILNENAFESSTLFETELITDQNNLLSDIVDDFWRVLNSKESLLFLEYLFKTKINVDIFFDLIKNNISKPFLDIIPKAEYIHTEKIEDKYSNIFKEVQNIWQDAKNDILNLLKSAGLNKNKYSDKIINDLYKNADALFNPVNTSNIILFKYFNKLSKEYLKKAVKKNYRSPSHIFFDKCAELLESNLELFKLFQNNLFYYFGLLFYSGLKDLDRLLKHFSRSHHCSLFLKLHFRYVLRNYLF